MSKDYKYMVDTPRKAPKKGLRPRRHHLLAAALATIAITALLSINPYDAEATREKLIPELTHIDTATKKQQTVSLIQDTLRLPEHEHTNDDNLRAPAQLQSFVPGQQSIVTPEVEETIATKISPHSDAGITEEPGKWHETTIKAGDNMALIFARTGFKPSQLHEIVSMGEKVASLKRIKPGQTIRIRRNESNEILELRQVMSETKSLQVIRKNNQLHAATIEQALEPRKAYTTGVINQSLYLSAQQSGMSDNLIMELAAIFGWDVDFALDIRKGDQFTVIYEELFLGDRKIRDGNIIAAEFINQGKTYQAILFTDPNGNSNYFTPEGYSMRKAFLRSPVDFRRISSHFQRERWHPVLGKKRPHKGVDYAAATGTPIKAAGDGKIVFRGRKGGYGHTIILRHGNNITTLYAHMSSYKRGLSNGSRVKQGQVIGYVGKSGLATGPHLHYEFQVNGVHRNPLTVKLPHADPLPDRYHAQFKQMAQPLIAQLQLYKDSQLALQE